MFTRTGAARTLCFAGALLAVSGVGIGMTAGTSLAGAFPGTTVFVDNTPYSSYEQNCDHSRDGWHISMTQLAYPYEAVIDGSDFGPVDLTFSNGSHGVALFTDLTGGNVAHFLDSTHNQAGNFTITSASLTFPDGSDITGYGQFVISHPPCVETTATTSTEAPATTEAPTTTAAPTINLVLSQVPLPPSTTVAVASEAPSTTLGGSTVALPKTGNSSGRLALLGVGLLGLGLTLSALARRPRQALD